MDVRIWQRPGTPLSIHGLLVLLLMQFYTSQAVAFERVQSKDQTTAITREGSTTFDKGTIGATGYQYTLTQDLTDHPSVFLNDNSSGDPGGILHMLAQGKANLAAWHLNFIDIHSKTTIFATSNQNVTPYLLNQAANRRPKTAEDRIQDSIDAGTANSDVERGTDPKQGDPYLVYVEPDERISEDLIDLAANERLVSDAIENSTEVALERNFIPALSVELDLTANPPIVRASLKDRATSLDKNAMEFFAQIQKAGASQQIFDSRYGHVWQLGYIGLHTFMKNVIETLQQYRPLFEQIASETELDWRLLAAMAYQESFWNPKAVSPTGVRGLMMLTRATASELGINDRGDPIESVRGGARYYKIIKRKIPKRISDPDRSWMALAAYNVGFGHLEDARVLTQKLGGDPDRWADVKERLVLLNQPEWYKQTKRGYARGHEPVLYVRNIRNYFDILVRLSTNTADEKRVAETAPDDYDPHSM